MMIVHTGVMEAAKKAAKRNPLGPTGEVVRANFKRLRGDKSYASISRMLEEVKRPIPELGIRRIESGDRRVDVDDLVALAAVLGVSPVTLLMPEMVNPAKTVAAPTRRKVSAAQWWKWLTADLPLPGYTLGARRFGADSRPDWDPGVADDRLWSKDDS